MLTKNELERLLAKAIAEHDRKAPQARKKIRKGKRKGRKGKGRKGKGRKRVVRKKSYGHRRRRANGQFY